MARYNKMMGNVFDTLMDLAGFSRKRRTPSARARGNADAARARKPAGKGNAKRSASPIEVPPPVAGRPVSKVPRIAEAATSKGKATKVARPVPPRQERPVGGFKMAVVLAVFVTGGTWLGSQVQGFAAPSREVVSRDLHEMRPKTSNFTF